MRMIIIGFLVFFILSACNRSEVSIPIPQDEPTSLSTDTPHSLTATAEPSSKAAPRVEKPSGIAYSSVAEALADLKSRDDVSVKDLQGWIIVIEADGLTNWSFPPPNHPAYPAVAKRVLYRDQDGWHLKMDILCEATEAACAEFVRYFEALNEPINQFSQQQQP